MRQNAEIWSLPVGSQGEPLGAPKRLIASSRESSRSSFSPDGATIAFNSDRGGPMNLWLFDVATHAVRQLTRGDGGDYQASWAPDGSWLAFFSGRGGSLDIWRVDVNGSSLQCLTSGEGINVNPFVSPDGRAIAFHSDRDGRMEVFLMNADGSDVRQLTSCGASGHFLRWTADGRHMVFRSGAAKPRVARASIEGGELIEYPSVAGGAHISLSPDGLLMFDVMAHQAMWVSPLDGSLPRKAFEFDDPEIRIDYPVWSPDGRSVLFDRLRPQGGDVWMVELG
jgi:TolB protein